MATSQPHAQRRHHLVIVGAGPAGLMAAERLATAGQRVTLFEAMPNVGRKFLLAGRGGLNQTHSEPTDRFATRNGQSAPFVSPWLDGFDAAAAVAWAEGLGQATFIGSSGRVFPKAMKASPLLRAWLARLHGLGVTLQTRARLVGFDGRLPQIQTENGQVTTVECDAAILALGGASWPKLGSDGAWTALLAKKGVDLAPLQPSNCGVQVPWSDHLRHHHAGAVLKAVQVTCGGVSARGDVIITANGLEGGPIYALIPHVRAALAQPHAALTLDLRPDAQARAIGERLVKSKPGQSVSTALRTHARLSPAAIVLLREFGRTRLPDSAMGLARLIKAVSVPVTGLADLDRAISSAGGITRGGVDDNLMLTALPGVFVAGEMLDWDAPTGGYLLQACLASGVYVAAGAQAWLRGPGDALC